jgi:RNA polymerase sigma-70 factor, ECF subfamily
LHDTEAKERFERIGPSSGCGLQPGPVAHRNRHDAEDVLQEAFLRAFDGYRGGDPQAWLLKIVRNTCYSGLKQRRGVDLDALEAFEVVETRAGPEEAMVQQADTEHLREALEALPMDFREAILLREFEGLSYKEIAEVTDVPLGTVKSRLARARQQLQRAILKRRGARP